MNKLLPPNSTKFEMNYENTFSRISSVEIKTRTFNDAEQAPVQVLPWLAWERSVDIWDNSWTEEQKRNVIKNALYNHSIKGTFGALELALNSLGFPVIVQEWFNMVPMGKPYTFKLFIKTSEDNVSVTDYKELLKVVRAYKNLRSHLIDTTVMLNSPSNLQVNATTQAGHEAEFVKSAGGLHLDGTWALDGTKKLNGVDM
ncbi:phage tail protein I [Alkanindiges illinoisensis]|uniref:Phage tail protein I n=1 Tax=Alkanindiges illinoisensis TaxID=197183 RepID=A0A4Y7XB52_9GAMM|nr:phage tail protein I [Alkanindiges illinoisensis]TEU24684.1 phage tail protein I [Alkanindiges illinoisensis]